MLLEPLHKMKNEGELSMDEKVWDYTSGRRFRYISLTQTRLSEALHLFRTQFFAKEKMAMHIGLQRYPEAIGQLDEIVTKTAADGVSLAAIDEDTDKVIACQLNKIQVKKNPQKNFFQEVNCTHPAVKAYLQLNSKLDSLLNPFDFLHTDCYCEIRFLIVKLEFQGKGIEKKLMELSLQNVQSLKNNDNIKVPIKGKPLPLSPIPTAVVSISRSALMREICQDYKFRKLKEVSFYIEPALSTLIDLRKLPKIPTALILYKDFNKV